MQNLEEWEGGSTLGEKPSKKGQVAEARLSLWVQKKQSGDKP